MDALSMATAANAARAPAMSTSSEVNEPSRRLTASSTPMAWPFSMSGTAMRFFVSLPAFSSTPE